MSEYIEIAYSVMHNRLCLFTGTGFSKAVTDGAAPSWDGLLEQLCNNCAAPEDIKDTLFPDNEPKPLALEEAAQVIEIDLEQVGENIHNNTAEIVSKLTAEKAAPETKKFISENKLKIVTTNYDKLAEELAGSKRCHSIVPGRPIPRSEVDVEVIHIHGSVDVPERMVITSDDYFKFLGRETYFSRKLSTILHENTVVILGYSLGDTNLKAIINDYRTFSRTHRSGSSIFLVSRSAVGQRVKDYYSKCYGIRVIDDLEVEDFFKRLNQTMPQATESAQASVENINKVLHEGRKFKQSYLKSKNSFFEIISALNAIGASVEDAEVVKTLGNIISEKRKLTGETNAWEQYAELATWLIHLASILELAGSTIEDTFLQAVQRSMETMSKEKASGYSWAAYQSWDNGWNSIISSNRKLIKDHILSVSAPPDAKGIVLK